jgi:fatty acid desaturase
LSRRVHTQAEQKMRRRRLVWVFGAVAFVSTLLYLEQTGLLYVLSTLAMCVLLFVVAFSDLEGRGEESGASTPNEKEAATGDIETATAPAHHPEHRVTKRRRLDAA